jgi:hypothetical protein
VRLKELVTRAIRPYMSASDDAQQALVRAYIACRLALESIPDLPAETAKAVREPIREFCGKLEPFVEHLADRDSLHSDEPA